MPICRRSRRRSSHSLWRGQRNWRRQHRRDAIMRHGNSALPSTANAIPNPRKARRCVRGREPVERCMLLSSHVWRERAVKPLFVYCNASSARDRPVPVDSVRSERLDSAFTGVNMNRQGRGGAIFCRSKVEGRGQSTRLCGGWRWGGLVLLACLGQASSMSPPIITTVAGGGTVQGDGGLAVQARLNNPVDVAVGIGGNLFIAERYGARVRKVDATGAITTVAGIGTHEYTGDGIAATSAAVSPTGVAVDAQGNVYVTESLRIRKISVNGMISTIVGNGTNGFSGDGGLATSASISNASDPEVDGQGNLYFIDGGNRRIRKVDTQGVITTVAGSGALMSVLDDGARALDVGLEATGLGIKPDGDLIVVTKYMGLVLHLASDGRLRRVAGGGFFGSDAMAVNVNMTGAFDAAVDARANIYVSRGATVMMVTPDGAMHHLAGTWDTRDGYDHSLSGYGGDGGAAAQGLLKNSMGIAVGPDGQVMVADQGNARVRNITPMAQPETPSGMFALRWAASRDGGGGALVAGDFNADGRTDIATVPKPGRYDFQSWAVDRVCFLLQSSNGRFEDEGAFCVNMPAPTAALPARPSPTFRGVGLAVADMNGDGADDVLAASGAGIAIVPGSRSRDMRATWFSGAWNNPTDELVIGDVNLDGVPDVVARTVESLSSPSVGLGIYFGSRNGIAQSVRFVPLGFDFSSLRAVDLTGDGREDLAMGYVNGASGEGGAAVLRHDGHAGFLPPQLYPVSGTGRASVASGDFNGDRRRDLAVTRVGYQTATLIHMLHQDAYGGLQPATPLETTLQPSGLLAVDLDRDTLDDLLVLNVVHWSVGYYQNRYGRGLGAQVRYQLSPPDEEDVNTLVAVDINHDGHLDVVQASASNLTFLYGTGRRWGTAVRGSQPLLPGGQAVRTAATQPWAPALSQPLPSLSGNVASARRGPWVASPDTVRLHSLPQRLAWARRAISVAQVWIGRLSGWWRSLVSFDATETASNASMARHDIAMEASIMRRQFSSTMSNPAEARIAFAPASAVLRTCERFR